MNQNEYNHYDHYDYNLYDQKLQKLHYDLKATVVTQRRTNDKKVITNKANLELRKFFFTNRSATDWNMMKGEEIDKKLQKKNKETRPTIT